MIPALQLNDGHSISQLGFGSWPLRGEAAAVAVEGPGLDADRTGH